MLAETYLDLGNRHMFLGPGVAQVLPVQPAVENAEYCHPPHYSGPVYDRVCRQFQKRAVDLGLARELRMAS